MQLAKILLPVHDRTNIEPAAKAAFVLAARTGAEVEGFYPARPPIDQFMIHDEAGAPIQFEALINEAKKQARESRKLAEKRFKELAGAHAKVPSHFLAVEGAIAPLVGERGRFADLAVMGTVPGDEVEFWIDVRDGALFLAGRPALIVPNGEFSEKFGDTLVIAWKDGVEAARAVSAAIPFIAGASTVRIVSAGIDAASKETLAELRKYLSHYNKKVETAVIGEGKRGSAELLVADAAAQPDALLVMGAYSQWRWKEWVFGGVTEYVLHSASVPVLMVH